MDDLHNEPSEGAQAEEPTAEQLKQQLEDKEQDIQTLKGRWGERNAEQTKLIQELQAKQAEFEGRISEQRELITSGPKEPEPDPYSLSEEELDEIRDDPTRLMEVVRDSQSRTVGVILEALKERDALIEKRYDDLDGTLTSKLKELNPELQQWRPAIEELKKKEQFSKLDDDVLIAIAREKDMKPSMEYQGEAGGQRPRSTGEEKKAREFDPSSPEARILIQMFGSDQAGLERAKRVFERSEKKRIG
jgi:hypothetical protein